MAAATGVETAAAGVSSAGAAGVEAPNVRGEATAGTVATPVTTGDVVTVVKTVLVADETTV